MNILLTENMVASGQCLQLVRGDITDETTEAIVNAANAALKHGAGVAGAILRRGGSVIQEESDAWVRKHGQVSHSKPAWTTGGNLACRIVIHAVGPIWDGNEPPTRADANLAAAVKGSLRVADQLGLHSIAFPAISTGIFGFRKERAARVIVRAVQDYFKSPSNLALVRLVLFDAATINIFEKTWHDQFDSKRQN